MHYLSLLSRKMAENCAAEAESIIGMPSKSMTAAANQRKVGIISRSKEERGDRKRGTQQSALDLIVGRRTIKFPQSEDDLLWTV